MEAQKAMQQAPQAQISPMQREPQVLTSRQQEMSFGGGDIGSGTQNDLFYNNPQGLQAYRQQQAMQQQALQQQAMQQQAMQQQAMQQAMQQQAMQQQAAIRTPFSAYQQAYPQGINANALRFIQ